MTNSDEDSDDDLLTFNVRPGADEVVKDPVSQGSWYDSLQDEPTRDEDDESQSTGEGASPSPAKKGKRPASQDTPPSSATKQKSARWLFLNAHLRLSFSHIYFVVSGLVWSNEAVKTTTPTTTLTTTSRNHAAV